MMSTFMSYRIVILNGEKRGERLEIGRPPLTIGRAPSCDIQLPDPDIGEIHAQLSSVDDELQISAFGSTNLIRVNKSSVHESGLKHGDVIEIGATRLFIQSQRSSGSWERFAGLRKWRNWLTIGFPLLLLISVALTLSRCRHESGIKPVASPAPRRSYTRTSIDTNNTDWMVTNVSRIVIHPTVILTTNPPEIVEARELFIQFRTNTTEQEIETARREIDFATEFLAEARKAKIEAIPDSPVPATLLEEAEKSLALTAPAPVSSMDTNTLSDIDTNMISTIQADSLKN